MHARYHTVEGTRVKMVCLIKTAARNQHAISDFTAWFIRKFQREKLCLAVLDAVKKKYS